MSFISAIFIPKIIGNRRATSISKIRNTTARRKNRIEKGKRAESLGSNPHSKGLFLFRELLNLDPSMCAAISSAILNLIAIRVW